MLQAIQQTPELQPTNDITWSLQTAGEAVKTTRQLALQASRARMLYLADQCMELRERANRALEEVCKPDLDREFAMWRIYNWYRTAKKAEREVQRLVAAYRRLRKG